MSKSNAFENDIMLLIFNNTNISNLGDATGVVGSTTPGSIFVSLHTADPAEGGTQSTNETTYGSYARVAVARSGVGWTVTGNAVTNAALVSFPQCTSGPVTVTHFGLGVAVSGGNRLLYSGALTTPLAVGIGTTPQFPAGDIDGTED